MALTAKARQVLDYWFGELDHSPAYFKERNALWFGGGDEVDGYIRASFEDDVIAAASGRLADWAATPRGCLALIVLLDQFSLNLYREQPRSYEQSEMALPLARKMIERGWDWSLTPAERCFVYLPFEHSENLKDQELCVSLYEKLARDAPADFKPAMESVLDWARRHERVVRKYGRFPDRNEVFGRKSTPEEEAFLASDEAPF